jgi:hypothetical protein
MFGEKGSMNDENNKAEWGLFPRLTDLTLKMMINEKNKFFLTISSIEFYMM